MESKVKTSEGMPAQAPEQIGQVCPTVPEPAKELRKLKTELKRSQKRFQGIFENAIEGIFQTDARGRFTEANPSLARMHGYDSPKEFMDSVAEAKQLFVNPEDHSELIRLLGESGSVRHFEAQMHGHDNSVYWVSTNVMVFRDKKGKPLRYEGTMLNITGRKQIEEALRESEERYRVAIENSNDAVGILENGIVLYANKQYVDMFEYESTKDILGKSVMVTIHPDNLDDVMDIINRRSRGEPVPSRYEFKGITKTGKTIFVEVSASTITFRGKPFYLIYLRDISERKEAEATLIQSHKELQQLNRAKTKAVDHISHELKTPLSVVQGNIRILKRKLMNTASYHEMENIINSLERNMARLFEISRVTDEIFRVSQEVEAGILVADFDRLLLEMEHLSEIPRSILVHWKALKEWTSQYLAGGAVSSESLDLYESAVAVVESIREITSGRNVKLNVKGERGLFVDISPAVLREVIKGLVKNAIENTPDGGVVDVVTKQQDKSILLSVTDSGVGITEDDQAFILDGLYHTKETELYSTKQPYEFGAGGKGLDLLKIKSYSRRYGFEISLRSRRCLHIPTESDICPGDTSLCTYCRSGDDCVQSGGTTFTITFPHTMRVNSAADE